MSIQTIDGAVNGESPEMFVETQGQIYKMKFKKTFDIIKSKPNYTLFQ